MIVMNEMCILTIQLSLVVHRLLVDEQRNSLLRISPQPWNITYIKTIAITSTHGSIATVQWSESL